MKTPDITVHEASFEAAQAIDGQIPEFNLDAGYDMAERLWAKGIGDKDPYCVVGEVGGTTASYAIAYNKPKSMHIWLTGTNPEFRGHGLLAAMVATISAEASRRGYSALTVKSYPRFETMIRQLGKLGFEPQEVVEGAEDGAVRFTRFL